MSAAKVELGRYLFYDNRMSVNGKESCGTCHRQELAFTDGRAQAEGATGQLHPRSSMSLVNVAYVPFLTWANPTVTSLEAAGANSDAGRGANRAGPERSRARISGRRAPRSDLSSDCSRKLSLATSDPYTLSECHQSYRGI